MFVLLRQAGQKVAVGVRDWGFGRFQSHGNSLEMGEELGDGLILALHEVVELAPQLELVRDGLPCIGGLQGVPELKCACCCRYRVEVAVLNQPAEAAEGLLVHVEVEGRVMTNFPQNQAPWRGVWREPEVPRYIS